ncbi:MAG: ParB/RepB/Spo0J family partition protein [Crinalium sp.]
MNKHNQKLESTIEVPLDTREDRELISISNTAPINRAEAQKIRLDLIVLRPDQPRRYFDPEKMAQLTESIRTHGVIEPIIVRPIEENKYELVAGERRYRGAKEAGLKEIPVIILELDDHDALQLTLVENLIRDDLNPVEEARGVLDLIGLKLNVTSDEARKLLYKMHDESRQKSPQNVWGSEQGDEILRVFQNLDRFTWETFIKTRLPLLKLPEDVLEALSQGQIEYTKARAIAQIKDPEGRIELLETAIAEGLSLKEIKKRVAEIKKATEAELEQDAENEDEETDETGEKPDKADKPESLKSEMNKVYNALKKSKVWKDKNKQDQLQKILSDMESLLNEE